MKHERQNSEPGRRRRRQGLCAEALETRTLLTAAETFSGPSLTDLIMMARQGEDTAPAAIDRMLQSLETQLTAGPLADLSSATVDGNGFVQEVQSLESSYEQNVDGQLSPEFPHVDEMLKLAGQAIVADVISLNQQNTVGLISNSALADRREEGDRFGNRRADLLTQYVARRLLAAARRSRQTCKPLCRAWALERRRRWMRPRSARRSWPRPEAYLSDLHSGLEVTNPKSRTSSMPPSITSKVRPARSPRTTADAESQLSSAISTFDTAMLDTNGLFGPGGPSSARRSRIIESRPEPDEPANDLGDRQRLGHGDRAEPPPFRPRSLPPAPGLGFPARRSTSRSTAHLRARPSPTATASRRSQEWRRATPSAPTAEASSRASPATRPTCPATAPATWSSARRRPRSAASRAPHPSVEQRP